MHKETKRKETEGNRERFSQKEVGRIIARAKGNRRVPIQTIVLTTLAVSGGLAVALVAPKMLQLFEHLRPASRTNAIKFNRRVAQALSRLKQRGLISVQEEDAKGGICLTEEGEKVIDNLYAGAYSVPIPARWDGKWRLVMFDVPEKRKKMRDTLRVLLRSAGFVRFQDSAWVQPYPCDELVTLLRAHLESGKGEVRYLTMQFVDESDYALRKHFSLSE